MHEWIEARKQMPEERKEVLIHYLAEDFSSYFGIAWFDAGLWWFSLTAVIDRQRNKYVYWMSLPRPPQRI